MNERPIIFSGPMVRAILAGTKTQTRRVVKPQPMPYARPNEQAMVYGCKQCPYEVGSFLWVRETWAVDGETVEQARREHEDVYVSNTHGPYYRATEVAPDTLRWRSPIHMPRWASRITLEVTDVLIEHVQDIIEKDAKAEGVSLVSGHPRHNFRLLWDSINAKSGCGWNENPWVWAISFRMRPTVET